MRLFARSLRLALGFLTRIPVGRLDNVSQSEWQWFVAGFPLCGYLLGALSFAIPALVLQRQPSAGGLHCFLLASLSVALLAYLTRGLHLDGFADVCDALGGGFDRDSRLEILKDPHIGSFGVVAVGLLLLVKVAAAACLLESGRISHCIATVAAARLSLALLCAAGRYPRQKGTAASVVGNVAGPALTMAALFTAPCLLLPQMLAAALGMLFATLAVKRMADRAFGGVTGDVLGACCELCETVGCVVLALTTL